MKSRDTRRKFGQNYLKDPAILIQMGGAINPKKSENILEIGPGLGALTNQINLEGVNIVGIDIKPEFPRRPDIVIQNNFKLTTEELSKKVIKKIQSIVVNR